MYEQIAAFDIPADPRAKGLTASARQQRAIANFCDKGYRVKLSAHPQYYFINILTDIESKHHISELEAQYDQDRRSAARERSEEKKRLAR